MCVNLCYIFEWDLRLSGLEVVDLLFGKNDANVAVQQPTDFFRDPFLDNFQLLENLASRILTARLLPSNYIQF